MSQENGKKEKKGLMKLLSNKWFTGIAGVVAILWILADIGGGMEASGDVSPEVREERLLEAVQDGRKLFNNNLVQLDWSKDAKTLKITDKSVDEEYSFKFLSSEDQHLYYKGTAGVIIVRVSGKEVLGYSLGKTPEDAKKTLGALRATD